MRKSKWGPLSTTLEELKEANACTASYRRLCRELQRRNRNRTWGKDRPIPLKLILEINGRADAFWCLMRLEGLKPVWSAYIREREKERIGNWTRAMRHTLDEWVQCFE